MPARTFRDILAELAARSDTTREKGTRFELLTQAFFQTDALYTSIFTNVWRWSEWPGSQGRSETGIDLVAQNADDEKYTAIQCKFYAPQNTIAKPDIDSFLSASGTTEFTKRIIVSPTEKWNRNAEETIEGQQIPVSRIAVPDFEKSSINWDTFDLDTPEDMTRVQQKRPREDQLEAIDAVLDGFKQHDRGKLIMACGTGKTYTALRIAEEQVPPGGTILFLAPSITLVSQSVREWGNRCLGLIANPRRLLRSESRATAKAPGRGHQRDRPLRSGQPGHHRGRYARRQRPQQPQPTTTAR